MIPLTFGKARYKLYKTHMNLIVFRINLILSISLSISLLSLFVGAPITRYLNDYIVEEAVRTTLWLLHSQSIMQMSITCL